MAILVDLPISKGKGKFEAHMASDKSLKELHEFAKTLGVKKNQYQVTIAGFARYNINISKRLKALELGAKEATPAEFMRASKKLTKL